MEWFWPQPDFIPVALSCAEGAEKIDDEITKRCCAEGVKNLKSHMTESEFCDPPFRGFCDPPQKGVVEFCDPPQERVVEFCDLPHRIFSPPLP